MRKVYSKRQKESLGRKEGERRLPFFAGGNDLDRE